MFGTGKRHAPSLLFQVLPHVRLNENTGHLKCINCGTEIKTVSNRQRDLSLTLKQQQALDAFSALHRHPKDTGYSSTTDFLITVPLDVPLNPEQADELAKAFTNLCIERGFIDANLKDQRLSSTTISIEIRATPKIKPVPQMILCTGEGETNR